MKKLALVAVLAFLPVGCCTVEKAAVAEIDASHALILPKYRAYIDADAKLSADQKNDAKVLADTLDKLTKKLRDSIK